MATREQNERRFPNWDELPGGGRRYYRTVKGRVKNYARYVKDVDADEITLSIVQEIYTDDGNLIARHQKYPDDTGHEIVESENP
jgi:hypothetical protein